MRTHHRSTLFPYTTLFRSPPAATLKQSTSVPEEGQQEQDQQGGTTREDNVMRDQILCPERRDEMPKAAAPYLHAKRAPENRDGHTIPPMIYTHPPLEAQCG